MRSWELVMAESATITKARKKLQIVAMFGYYHRNEMYYVSTKTHSEHLGERFAKDNFAPPPNVPTWLDCSGFTAWCYWNALKINIGGWTGPQWNLGIPITLAQLKVGDLCFYGTPWKSGGAAHVIIYVGHGIAISHGMDEGPIQVTVSEYRTSEWAGARTFNLFGKGYDGYPPGNS